jgi:hypothetical protein
MTVAATPWYNERSIARQSRPVAPPKWNVAKDWQPPIIPVVPTPKVASALGHKELKVLNRLTDGCTLTRVSGGWRLSSTNPGNAQAYCKIKSKIIDRLAELGHVAKWGDKVAITGKGSAFIGKGSVARIA